MSDGEKGEPDRRERSYRIMRNVLAVRSSKFGEQNFKFDHLYREQTKTAEIFKRTKYLVEDALIGNNCVIFAYGQTGSGKTYTLMGEGKIEGIAQLSFRYMYKLIDQDAARFDVETFVQMV